MLAFVLRNKLALILILLCAPLALKKIAKNAAYGFRIERAMQGPEEWYRVNQIGAVSVILTLLTVIMIKQALLAQDQWAKPIAGYGALIDAGGFFVGVAIALVLIRRR
jgi:hypothetical protein